MNKNAIIANMFARYNRLSGTHNYIMPVLEDGIVYAVFTTADVVSKVLSLDVSSRGNGYSIRYKRATKNTQAILKAGATAIVPLCSVEYLESVAKTLGKRINRGDAFEKLLAEKYGIAWTSSGNAKFTTGGDLVINGTDYQVKYVGATFTNEAILARLEAQA